MKACGQTVFATSDLTVRIVYIALLCGLNYNEADFYLKHILYLLWIG